MSNRKLLFSVTMKDIEIQTFCTGGPGGQKQNKAATGVRLIHKASGAIGESREFKSQNQNKQAAFKRLAHSDKMTRWIIYEAARLSDKTQKDLIFFNEAIVEKMMDEKNLKIEIKDFDGRWIELEDEGD